MRRLNACVSLASALALVAVVPPALATAPTAAPPAVAPHHARVNVRHRAGRRAITPVGAEPVAAADAAARVQPSGAGYVGAMQVYAWSDGALYEVYAAPGEVTDIVLEPGETLAGTGPVAAGDTVRWVIGNTESGAGETRQVHILVKPTRGDLRTNLVINTDRRTYHLELRATPARYTASVSWRYPAGELVAIHQSEAEAMGLARRSSQNSGGLDLDHLSFRYKIQGPRPPWRPIQVFDDGRQTFIEFPPNVTQGDMPPLFAIGPDGKSAELVNYRVQGQHMVVDRIFQVAELRMGDKHSEQRVRIERER